MRTPALAVILAVAAIGCEASPVAAPAVRSFSAVGAHDVAQWLDASVPGSQSPRAGSNLPFYAVCPVDGDDTARAAAILSDARLRLFDDGSAELHLAVGHWARVGGVESASSETLTRWGTWAEATPGQVTLSGFGVPGLGTTLAYTDIGNAALSVRLACPGAASVPSVQPTVALSRDD